MRYNMKDRILRPCPEDGKLWRALDDLKAKYDKMAEMHQPVTDRRESRQIVPAKVYLANGFGLIDYREFYYLRNGKAYGMNKKMKDRITNFRADMRAQGIPQCIVSRQWTVDEMKVIIKRWLNEQRKVG